MNSGRYNKLSVFLRNKFGSRVEKICVDGGFTCPNRDGHIAFGGCIFCGEKRENGGLSNEIALSAISRQVKDALLNQPKNAAERFIVYFQNFSNTYADINTLRQRYDAALIDERIVALAVATRPDCITDEIAGLLAGYSQKYYVWVELGLQTANEETAEKINRGYRNGVFTRAVEILKMRGIDTVAHLIFGLPGEDDPDILSSIDFINGHAVNGVKIHSLYVTRAAGIYSMYERGEYAPQSFEDYIRRLTLAITHLRKDIIVHRITGDCPRGQLIAPEWNNRKKLIRNALESELEKNDLYQGRSASAHLL